MNYSQILKADIADGPGVRVGLFVSGCHHHCKGCFNQEAWNENYGIEYTQDTENRILEYLDKPYIRGLSLLGGEPLEYGHIPDLCQLVVNVKKTLPTKDIWVYTGYELEELFLRSDHTWFMLEQCDVLVDGPFVQELKDLRLPFRGSSNQRIIDLKKTLDKSNYNDRAWSGKIILSEYM